jgi:hypothetical protein
MVTHSEFIYRKDTRGTLGITSKVKVYYLDTHLTSEVRYLTLRYKVPVHQYWYHNVGLEI